MQGLDAHRYGGPLDCTRKILAEDGIAGFYHGVRPRLARVCLDVGLTFSIFNGIKRFLLNYAAKKGE